MFNDQTQVQIFVLTLASLSGMTVALLIARNIGRLLNFRTLVLSNYVLVTAVSGIAHLANNSAGRVGYYDIRDLESTNTAIASTCVGLVALSAALLRRIPRNRRAFQHVNVSFALTKSERRIIILLLIILIPITLWSTFIIQNYAAHLDTERIVTLDAGMARYSYAAKWFTWTVSFAAILFAGSRISRNRLLFTIVAAFCMLAIVSSLTWTGGRSIIVVMVFPLFLILLPRVRNFSWFVLPIAFFALADYLIRVTAIRGGSERTLSFTSWLDWQWGRFSMLGWASDEVESNGYMFGETYAAAGADLIGGMAQIAGFPLRFPDWISSTQLAGMSIRRDDITWIVPGMNAELYLNFGLLGVAVGFYGLGILVNWVDTKYAKSSSVLVRLSLAYIGSLLVFRSVPSDAGSIPSYLIYMGTPLLFAAWYSHRCRRRQHLDAISRRASDHQSGESLPPALVK